MNTRASNRSATSHLFAHRTRSSRRQEPGPPHIGGGAAIGYGDPDDGQDYVDRSVIDFDPAAGLLSGTAFDGREHVADDDRIPAP